MYFIAISFLFLMFYLFASRARGNAFLFVLSPVLLSFFCINVYFNGGDWVNYFRLYHGITHSFSPELFFTGTLQVLKHLTLGEFSFSILLYFWGCFSLIALFFYLPRYRALTGGASSFYLLISLLFFILGPTLVLEQLRQFASVICLMYAYGEHYNRNKTRFMLLVLCAVLFHISSLLFVLFLWCASQRISKKRFLCLALSFVIALYFIFQNIPLLFMLSNISALVFVADKISLYLNSVGEIHIGIRQMLCLVFIIIYGFKFNEKNLPSNGWVLMRLFVLGCSLFLISSAIPFVDRLFYYFLFFYLLFISSYIRRFKFTAFKKIIMLYSFLLFSLFSFSYYNNPIAPFHFFGGRNFIGEVVNQDVNYEKLIDEIDKNFKATMEKKEGGNR